MKREKRDDLIVACKDMREKVRSLKSLSFIARDVLIEFY